jgi:hypothetical protein
MISIRFLVDGGWTQGGSLLVITVVPVGGGQFLHKIVEDLRTEHFNSAKVSVIAADCCLPEIWDRGSDNSIHIPLWRHVLA